MGFRQYVEMTCEFCGCADYYQGKSIKKAKEHWLDMCGIFYKSKPFCNEKCKENYIKKQNGEIDTGLNSGPPNSIIRY